MSVDYDKLLRQVRHELELHFTDPNDPGLHERRVRLRALFAAVPSEHAAELFHRLEDRKSGDDLAESFHHRLATPTRNELLGILRMHFPAGVDGSGGVADGSDGQPPDDAAGGPAPDGGDAGTAAGDGSPPAPPWPTEQLPEDARSRYEAAVQDLRARIEASDDERAWRYRCWLDKLAAGGDDRVIEWHRICPATSGAIGAAYLVGPCDLGAGTPVDQSELETAISAVGDVEPANRTLGFITHLRTEILFTHEMTSSSLHLENFRRFHDDVQAAVQKLDIWANNPMGGSSAMPRAYVSIKDWIGERQRDANSVYSCL